MLSLVEIAELEAKQRGVILFDSSAVNLNDFGDYIFDVKKYYLFNNSRLIEAKGITKEFLDFVKEKNTFTVEEAVNDFKNLSKIVSSKQKLLDRFQNNAKLKYGNEGSQKQELFKEICDNIFNIYTLAKPKIFKQKNEREYNLLYDMSRILCPKLSPYEVPPKHLQFYASALCLSLEQTPAAFIVRSRKFEERLILLIERLKEKSKKTFQNLDLHTYPIRLYFDSGNNGYTVIYTTQNEKPAQRVHT